MADSCVIKSENSERKERLGFGGRYMTAMTRGAGPGSLKAMFSKE